MQHKQPTKKTSTSAGADLMRYAGLATQLLVSIGIAVLGGYKLDEWIQVSIPLFVWLLPLIVVCLLIYKLIKETSKKESTNAEKKKV